MKVPFYRHELGAEHAQLVADVLATPFLTSGGVGRAVEAQLCQYFGVKHAALVNSWTNGAVAALLALDVGPGDEVIVPAQTFIASANVVELIGAKVIFADVDSETLLISPAAVRAAVTPRTKAVIAVHLYGQMVDIAALRAELRDRPDISIIEDAAHCFEGEFAGNKPGKHSKCAMFSFYATKNVTCGEGGAIITNDTSLYELVLQTRSHGMSAGAIDRFKLGGYQHWDMMRMGAKANLPDLLACLLPGQIETADRKLERRNEIGSQYEHALSGMPVRVPKHVSNAKHARHLFAIHVPTPVRDTAIEVLGENGIGVTVNYRAVPTTMYYKNKYGYQENSFPVSEEWGKGTISLPLFPSLTREEQDYVISVLKEKVVPLVDGSRRKSS
jgi:dTDP-4-amino-4,6-dideoxygalactose transaminase